MKCQKSKSYATLIFLPIITFGQLQRTVTLVPADSGRVFEGIGGVSAGASSRLLIDYKEPYRSDILDYLYKPNFGAAMQALKVEIGGGENSTSGSEPSHAITRAEVQNPVDRGYEFWLMNEARKRNPDIQLQGLPWSYPGWISNRFSQDAADWFTAFVQVAKQKYNMNINWLAASQNEIGTDRNWIVNQLRPTLNSHGFQNVKLQGPDVNDSWWQIFDTFKTDSVYKRTLQAVGYHYISGRDPWQIDEPSGGHTTPDAKASGKPLWATEEWSQSGQAWGGSGALYLARLINKNYAFDKITESLIWCPIASFYDAMPWSDTGPMRANRPCVIRSNMTGLSGSK